MSKFVLLAGAALLGAALSSPPPARADSCEGLWIARNEIYKAGGYCFRTRRAIAAFGNAGCRYDDIADVPLSANDRHAVADIVRQERMMGCPR